jgi:hypothetical protein
MRSDVVPGEIRTRPLPNISQKRSRLSQLVGSPFIAYLMICSPATGQYNISLEVKRSGREAEYSPPSNAEV